MSTLQQLKDLTKYFFPVLFGAFALVLIIESTKKDDFDNVICHKGEFNPDEAQLVTIDDLEGGNLPQHVADYKKGLEKEAELGAVKDELKDTINKLNQVFINAKVDPIKVEDSLRYDSAKTAFVAELKTVIPKYNDAKVSTNTIYKTHVLPALNSENLLKEKNAELKNVSIKQNQLFLIGGLSLLIVSIVMALFIANMINKQISIVVLVVVGVASIFFLYSIYDSIMDMQKHKVKQDRVYSETIQRMEDIKTGVLLYKEQNGKVPKDLDVLIDFIKNGNAISTSQLGETPPGKLKAVDAFKLFSGMYNPSDTLDEEAFNEKMNAWVDTTYIAFGDSSWTTDYAIQLGIVTIDSTILSVEEKLFTGPLAKKRPYSKTDFAADSLKFQAYTREKLIYQFKEIGSFNQADSTMKYKYRFEVRLARPMLLFSSDHECESREELILGSLTEDKFSGNW